MYRSVILVFQFSLFFCTILNSAPLKNIPQTLIQPNGDTLFCFASGDEFHNWLHDSVGYTIIQDKNTGFYVYADIVNDNLIPTKYLPNKVEPDKVGLRINLNISPSKILEKVNTSVYNSAQTISSTTQTGTINNLVIFIRFSDQSEFADEILFYENIFNNSGSDENSMLNYFKEVSYDQLNINTTFYPIPTSAYVLSYQDSNPRNYYVPYNSSTNPIGYKNEVQRTIREHSLLGNATNSISPSIPLSLNIDSDSDGMVDNICYIIQGDPEGWSELLWPHKSSLFTQFIYINGKMVFDYNIQLQTQTYNGVLCHEMFHTLGAPDLYHYTYDGIDPVCEWDLMASTHNPPQHMGAYMKYRYGKWIDSIPEILMSETYTLNPMTLNSNNCFKIISPNTSSEYFLVEYRNKEGTFESSIIESGLLAYRIIPTINGNAGGPPDEVYVYRPNGTVNNNGNPNFANYSSDIGRTEINDLTNPSSFLSDGSAGGLSIYNIGSSGATINFDIEIHNTDVISEFPYNQNFDSFTTGVNPERMEEGWINVNILDDGEWTVQNGPTPSSNTGPIADHTTGSGNYLYTESSSGTNPGFPNKSAYLLSPAFDLSVLENPKLTFYYHLYGSSIGSVSVDVYSGSEWTNDVFTVAEDQGDNWKLATVNLLPFSGIIQFRIKGITGTSYTSDMAIDDISIFDCTDGNNIPTMAEQINLPHMSNYEIEPDGDIDWFKVYLSANVPYSFSNSSAENFDTEFNLFGPGNSEGTIIGNLIEKNDDGAYGFQPYIRYTPNTSGYYYLRVAYCLNDYATSSSETHSNIILGKDKISKSPSLIESTTGNYMLTVNEDIDGNSVPNAATPVTLPHNFDYEINPELDIDWYSVYLSASLSYNFSISSPSNFDTKIWLFGPYNDGPIVAEDDDSGGDFQPQITYKPIVSGTYYLRISYFKINPLMSEPIYRENLFATNIKSGSNYMELQSKPEVALEKPKLFSDKKINSISKINLDNDSIPIVSSTETTGNYSLNIYQLCNSVNIKTILEGAYNISNELMEANLSYNIPATSPYSADPKSVDEIPIGVVDWLLLEIRDKNDNLQIVSSRSAFLLENGDVVDIDGISPVQFIAPPEQYYLVVKHRNHLPVMSFRLIDLR